MLPDGRVIVRQLTTRANFITFSGISFPLWTAQSELVMVQKPLNETAQHTLSLVRHNGFCMLAGSVAGEFSRLTNKDARPLILATLPETCRPLDGDMLFDALIGYTAVQVRISTAGLVKLLPTHVPANSRFISLAGIFFFTHQQLHPMTLGYMWKPAIAKQRVPSYRKAGTLCVLSGVLTSGISNELATLPQECRPKRLLNFATRAEGVPTVRIDVLPTGVVRRMSRSNIQTISLDGIAFTVEPIVMPGLAPVAVA